MSKLGRTLTDEETKLWRRVAARVRPRRPVAIEESASAPRASASTAEPARPAQPAPPQPKRAPAIAPPQDRSGERRVRRGQLAIAATLDLHGHNQGGARSALARFIAAAHAGGARTILVITGAGRSGQGVLKRKLPEWLAEPDLRALVSGYAPAHRSHGGDGACYVFLRRAREG